MCRSLEDLTDLAESIGGWAWIDGHGGMELRCGCAAPHVINASDAADDPDYYQRRAKQLRSCQEN